MKYRVVAYMRIDSEEEELFDSYEEAIREKENLEAMDAMNIYKIEEVDVLDAVPKEKEEAGE